MDSMLYLILPIDSSFHDGNVPMFSYPVPNEGVEGWALLHFHSEPKV